MKKGCNVYFYLLWRFLVAIGVLLLSQATFYLCNSHLFNVDGWREWLGVFLGNLRFGAATFGIVLAPYVVLHLLPFKYRWSAAFQKYSNIFLYIIPICVVLVANGVDGGYFQYTYHRLSGEIFCYLGVNGQFLDLLPHFFVDFWFCFLAFFVILALLLWANYAIRLRERSKYNNYLGNDLIGLILACSVMFVLMRGGFQPQWLRLSDASAHCQPKNSALVTNSAYTLMRTVPGQRQAYVDLRFDDDDKPCGDMQFVSLAASGGALVTPAGDTATRKNVVLIVLESFSQEYMGCYGAEKSYTPFLDTLANHCVIYQGRSNGKKSIEAVPAILSSIPTLTEIPFALTPKFVDSINALPWIFRSNGYKTSFYHGAFNGSMAFDTMCYKMGFEEYYGKNEYEASHCGTKADYDGVWGIFDEPFLKYTAHRLAKNKSPFFTTIYTISSHHPYLLPEDCADKYKGGDHPLLKNVQYTDHALQEFFDIVRNEPWFDNTLFVITADHPGQALSRSYNDYDGWYSVPMMFYQPSCDTHIVSSRIMQHLDIMPTIIDWLGLDVTTECMGTSAVQQQSLGCQMVYGSGYYMMVENNPVKPEEHEITVLSGNKELGKESNVKRMRGWLRSYDMRYCLPR